MPYHCVKLLKLHLYRISSDRAQMFDGCRELIKSSPEETDARSFPIDSDQVSVTLSILAALCDASKEEAALGV